jgi:hypothetical protein
MFANFFALFTVRKAIFAWTSNQSAGIVKVLFRGAFSQAESREYALKNIVNMLREGEVLEGITFVGIEE